MKKIITILLSLGVLGCAGCLLLIQLIPVGRQHANPPVLQEPNWDSPQTRGLAVRACFDCHSNESKWPWYSNIAPVSWLVWNDVQEGRARLNFSEWRGVEESDELAEIVLEGEMPPATYVLTHSQARLTQAEKKQLAQGLLATSRR